MVKLVFLSSGCIKQSEIGGERFAVCGNCCGVENSATRRTIRGSYDLPVITSLAVIQCCEVMGSPHTSSKIRGYVSLTTIAITVCVFCAGCGSTIPEVVGILHQVANLLPGTDVSALFSNESVLQLHVGW